MLDKLFSLQFGLVVCFSFLFLLDRNGFRLLKPGGTLVYSTCSLSKEQNEDVVSYLLSIEGGAVLQDLWSELTSKNDNIKVPCRQGTLQGTCLFEPALGTSGLFVAKIWKDPQHYEER